MTRRVMGIAAAILLIQLFFYIPSVVGTQLLPGDWAAYQPGFLLYIILDLAALAIIGYDRDGKDIREGSITKFAMNFGITAFAAWLVLTAPSPDVVTAAAKVPIVVYVLGFVAPTEELMFREVLPRVVTKMKRNVKGEQEFSLLAVGISSAVLFPAYHVWTYSLSAGLSTALIAALITSALAGVILALIYHYFGYGPAVAAHGWYDLFVLGAIGGLALAGTSLWLGPI